MSTRGTLLFFALLLASSRAQVTTATFYATVTDSSGALVPSAPVTLVHEETAAAITRQTNEAGEVTFDFLRVGTYLIRVEATGFKRFESKGLALSSGQTVRQSYSLEVGALSDTITVESAAPLVNTASSE